jgi:hypothetical protein
MSDGNPLFSSDHDTPDRASIRLVVLDERCAERTVTVRASGAAARAAAAGRGVTTREELLAVSLFRRRDVHCDGASRVVRTGFPQESR